MPELYPPDADINALGGTRDHEQGVPYIAIGESPYYTSFYKMLYRLLKVAARAGDLRVYRDGALTFGVREGSLFTGQALVSVPASEANTLTNNATNRIYVTPSGNVVTTTDDFPDPCQTPHIRLATIITAAGTYNDDDILDLRGSALMTVTGLNTRPALQVTGNDNADGTGSFTVQIVDAAGEPMVSRARLRCWISNGEYAPPIAVDGLTVTSGDLLRELTANADLEAITDATGQVTLAVNAPDGTYHCMAETDGRLFVGNATITGN